MANLQNLRPWRPGESGNKSGRPRLPEVLKRVRELASDEIRHLVAFYARMTRAEMAKKLEDPETSMIEIAIAAVLTNAAKTGDYSRLDFLLQRTIGKSKDVVDIRADFSDQFDGVPRENIIEVLRSGDSFKAR